MVEDIRVFDFANEIDKKNKKEFELTSFNTEFERVVLSTISSSRRNLSKNLSNSILKKAGRNHYILSSYPDLVKKILI